MNTNETPNCLVSLRRKSRWAALLMMLSLTPMLTSCYGHFPMTRLVYRVNGEVGGSVGEDSTQHRVVQSIVMWVFIIVPVYGVSMFVDAIVLNVIEFFSGSPVELGEHIAPDGTRVATVPSADGKTATMTISSKEGTVLSRTQFIKVSADRMEVRSMDGTLLGTAERGAKGAITFKDAKGTEVSKLPGSAMPAGSIF